MTERKPWFKFYVLNWRQSSAVRKMTLEARGLYLEILMDEWLEGGSLEADATLWAAQYSHLCNDWDESWEAVRACFVDCEDGRMRSEFLEAERLRAEEQKRKAAEWGKKGAEARKKKGASRVPKDTPKPPLAKEKEKEREKESKKREGARAQRAFYESPPIVEYFELAHIAPVRDAWGAFIRNKKRKAAGPLAESSVRRHLQQLAKLGPDKAIECLWYSADGNYPGLYYDRFQGPGKDAVNGHAPKRGFGDLLNEARMAEEPTPTTFEETRRV